MKHLMFLFTFALLAVMYSPTHMAKPVAPVTSQVEAIQVEEIATLFPKVDFHLLSFAYADETPAPIATATPDAGSVVDQSPSALEDMAEKVATVAFQFVSEHFPKAAPYINLVFEILKFVGLVATLLSVFFMGLSQALQLFGHVTGGPEIALKIKGFMDKVVYYAMKLSHFNAKKPN